MTELLYLKDSYLKEFEAEALEVLENSVVLDKTAFYPQGGGQPTDFGEIEFEGNTFKVKEVRKEKGKILHKLLDSKSLEKGKIKGRINWSRRYNLMKMHTSAHVLAAVIFKETGKLITGNQLEEEQSRMDFNVENYNSEWMKELEKEVNEELVKGHEVSVSFMKREEALKNPELVRLKDIMPPALEEWRIVKIGDIDLQADGGTHVKNTKEVGRIEIFKTENKGANNRRIYWRLKE